MDIDPVFKIVILGDCSVGKTSFLQHYLHKTFSEHTKSTLGIDFIQTTIQINNQKVSLQLWDTAGDEKFSSMGPMFLRHAHAAFLMCDLTNPKSYQNLGYWKNELLECLDIENGKEFPLIIVGNKVCFYIIVYQ